MKYELYVINNQKVWDSFVYQHKDSTCFHRYVWGNILEKSGLGKRLYLALEETVEGIISVIPLFIVTKPFKQLVPIPHSVYGHPLFSEFVINREREVISFLLKNIRKICFKTGCLLSYLTTPSFSPSSIYLSHLYKHPDEYGVSLRLHLEKNDPDFIWRRKLSKKRRNSIRKALRSRVKTRPVKSIKEFKEYYRMYLHVCKRKGSLNPLPFILFKLIWKKMHLSDEYLMMLAYSANEQPIAGIVAFLFKDTIHVWSNVSYDAYWNLNPNDLLYWDVIKYACENNFRFVDFGASSEKGTFLFKKQFGSNPINLYRFWVFPNNRFMNAILKARSLL